ncbi:MAG: hypothetical protein GX410_07330 [Elusimicrobia bacterium]|nr:hypothetical protein [Elusimicrobiota bacterium]
MLRKAILASLFLLALGAHGAYAEVHKNNCDGEDTGYKFLNKACENNPDTILVNCLNVCTRFDLRTGECKKWVAKELASAVCTSTGDKMILRKCSEEESEFAQQAIEQARNQAQKLYDELRALDITKLDVETQRRFGYARVIARGALNWINHDRQFLCRDDGQGLCKNAYAVAIPLTGGLAAIRLCEPLFSKSVEFAGATIIHEATHSCCATSDQEYYNSGPSDQPLSSQNWHNIADTYAYWIMNGLCVPGPDRCTPIAELENSGEQAAGGGGGGSW